MFIIFGLHRKKHHLATRQTICTACGRATALDFVMVKKAAHFFWIPFLPAGSTTYMKCTACSTEWKAPNVPLDFTYWGFALAALVLLVATFSLGIGNAPAPLWWGTGFLTIGVTVIYLFYLPSAFYGYPSVAGSSMTQATQPPAAANAADVLAPATPRVTANELYAKDYAARATCPACGMRYDPKSLTGLAVCPYCGAKV